MPDRDKWIHGRGASLSHGLYHDVEAGTKGKRRHSTEPADWPWSKKARERYGKNIGIGKPDEAEWKRIVWKRKDAGWYVSSDGRFEIESVRRIGGGGRAGEWLGYVNVKGEREWLDTYETLQAAKDDIENTLNRRPENLGLGEQTFDDPMTPNKESKMVESMIEDVVAGADPGERLAQEINESKPLDGSKKPRKLSDVTSYLTQKGYPGYKIFRGRGYYYFEGDGSLGDATHDWTDASMWINDFKAWTLDEWLQEVLRASGKSQRASESLKASKPPNHGHNNYREIANWLRFHYNQVAYHASQSSGAWDDPHNLAATRHQNAARELEKIKGPPAGKAAFRHAAEISRWAMKRD